MSGRDALRPFGAFSALNLLSISYLLKSALPAVA
jgi:hypothetical protein